MTLTFISKNGKIFGVADSRGNSPNKHAARLMTKALISSNQRQQDSLVEIFKTATTNAETFEGSSAALIARFRAGETAESPLVLDVLNVGNTALRVFRDSKSVFKTDPVKKNLKPVKKGEDIETKIARQFELQPDDVVVAGTDGLFDNLSEVSMASTVSEMRANKKSPKDIAQQLLKDASLLSLKPRVKLLHDDEKKSVSNGNEKRLGFKDDITVIVAIPPV